MIRYKKIKGIFMEKMKLKDYSKSWLVYGKNEKLSKNNIKAIILSILPIIAIFIHSYIVVNFWEQQFFIEFILFVWFVCACIGLGFTIVRLSDIDEYRKLNSKELKELNTSLKDYPVLHKQAIVAYLYINSF